MKHSRSIQLGPRARRAIRLAARFVNPLVLLIAGRRWMPIVGILHHRGRRTGRNYSSPLGMRPSAGGFVIPLTFSEHAAWYQNVRAAREAVVTYAGRDQVVTKPEVIDYAAAAASFPRYERAQFRLLGIRQFLQLSSVQKPVEENPMSIEMTKPRNSTIALVVIAVAQLMVVLDVAIVNVALPSIQHALKFNAADLEWVVNAYAIAFGGLLLLGGRMGDLYGRLRMFVAGTLVFAAGSLAGGLAATSTALIVARTAQGVGAAVHGWNDATTVVTLSAGAALVAAFVLIEALSHEPLLPLSLFSNRNRTGAYALSLANGAALSGTLFLLTLFLQNVLGMSPLQAGFAFLPTALGVIVGAQIASRIVARTGPRLPMAVGALMAAIGLFWLSAIAP